jgi:hypothetical protein
VLKVSDATFPIVLLQSVGRCTQEEIDAAHAVYVRVYARRRSLIAISDARLAVYDAKQRKLFADWTQRTLALDRGSTLATIVILDSKLLLGALTAMNWIAPPTIKQYAVGSPTSALETAQHVAEAARVQVPEPTWLQVRAWIDASHAHATLKPGRD